jgi:hypothetical protein
LPEQLSPFEEVMSLRARILAGEEISLEELRAGLDAARLARSAASALTQKGSEKRKYSSSRAINLADLIPE